MAADLELGGEPQGSRQLPATPHECRAELVDPDSASGLADMLHQYLVQNLAESAPKRRQGRRLRGQLAFRSAEDESVCVCIRFEGARIVVEDAGELEPGVPTVTADFLTVASLTTGEKSPQQLMREGRLVARWSLGRLPFLLRALRFLRVPGARVGPPRALWWLLAASAAGLLVAWLIWRLV